MRKTQTPSSANLYSKEYTSKGFKRKIKQRKLGTFPRYTDSNSWKFDSDRKLLPKFYESEGVQSDPKDYVVPKDIASEDESSREDDAEGNDSTEKDDLINSVDSPLPDSETDLLRYLTTPFPPVVNSVPPVVKAVVPVVKAVVPVVKAVVPVVKAVVQVCARWTAALKTNFVCAMQAEQLKGTFTSSGFKKSAWSSIMNGFNNRSNTNYTTEQLSSQYAQLKKSYMQVKSLRDKSGFGWDSHLHMVTADPECWERLIETNSEYKQWKTNSYPFYDIMDDLLNGRMATGKFASSTSTSTCPVIASENDDSGEDEELETPQKSGRSNSISSSGRSTGGSTPGPPSDPQPPKPKKKKISDDMMLFQETMLKGEKQQENAVELFEKLHGKDFSAGDRYKMKKWLYLESNAALFMSTKEDERPFLFEDVIN
jgi:hypothetical protein